MKELMREIAEEITTNCLVFSAFAVTCKHCHGRGEPQNYSKFVHEDYCLANKAKRMLEILNGK